jgi:hypothetical protein
MQVTKYRAQGAGLLTSATVFIYTAVVLFNALSSEPLDSPCIIAQGNVSGGLQVPYPANRKFTLRDIAAPIGLPSE